MTAWFEQFRHGDPANRDFQKRLIDTFVNAVYVFDDKLVLTYNYQYGTQTISLDEIASALSSDFDGATPLQKKRQPFLLSLKTDPQKHSFHHRGFLNFLNCQFVIQDVLSIQSLPKTLRHSRQNGYVG